MAADLKPPEGRRSKLVPALVLCAPASFAALLALWLSGGIEVDAPWAPSLDLRLHFSLDGLGALYALVATGVGAAVLLYSWSYLPRHLRHQGRSNREQTRFFGLLVLFMAAMVGLATAQDLVLLFVFWDLTAIASYFLIAYDRHEASSRWAALMALLVTGVSAVLLLIGALILYSRYGTFQLPELFERAQPSGAVALAAGLMVLAGLAKSAQVPFHFWLPRAMSAPSPVSAYLHSAAMVAAGVLLIGRVYPLVETSGVLLHGLLVVGAVSVVVGGLLALAQDDMKRVLAYSTFSQYGYVVFMYGLGSAAGAAAAAFYVAAHAIAKSALFLTAGAVTEATGAKRLSELGGLAKSMPLLALSSGVAVATVVALPLTVGFFADELLFKAAVERGPAFAVASTAGAALTFAYLGRFWLVIFTGAKQRAASPVPRLLVLPVAALALVALAAGITPEPLTRLASAAAEASVRAPVETTAAYYLDLRTENLMALATYAGGVALLALSGALQAPLAALARLGVSVGPERLYVWLVKALNGASDRIHQLEVRDLRTRVAAVLVPAGVLVAVALVAAPGGRTYQAGTVQLRDLGLLLMLALTVVAALAATVPRRHLTLVLALGTVGYGLAGVYAFLGAPDVALVAVLVESVVAVLFLGVLALLPAEVLRREAQITTMSSRRWRDPLVAVVSGGVAFALAWGALSLPATARPVSADHVRLAPEAHAKDVVTAILADFRGLDTLVEITVIGVAVAGVTALMRRRDSR